MSQMVCRLMMFLPLAMLCSCRSPIHSSSSALSHDKPVLAGPHAVSGSTRSLQSFSTKMADHSSTDLVVKGSPALHWTDEPDANSLPPVLAANMTCSCGRGHGNALESEYIEPKGACSGAGPCNPDSPGSWYDDEYLCDGGDQETEVTLNQKREVRGLDPEDTVAHFDTRDGRTLVKPSNSVCIYAPRFAAIRQVVATNVDDRQLAMEAIDNPLPPVIESAPHNPRQIEQPLPSPNVSSLRGPLALRDRTRGRELMNLQTVDELAMDFAAYEDFQIIRLGIHDRSQRALVQERVDAAIVWTENVSPEVILGEDPAIIDTSVEETGTIHHVDERGNPRLRVIKLASTSSARPGEEVEFTLRFDNVGNQPISNVTLIDRLTTRLEYVPNSAQSSLKASFGTQPHDTDSLVLRWEIREAIKPGEGGIIRFRCKVR